MNKEKTLKIRAIVYCYYALDINKFIKKESAILPMTVCDFIDYRYKDIDTFIEIGHVDNDHYIEEINSAHWSILPKYHGKGIEEIVIFRLIENFLTKLLTDVIIRNKPTKKQKIMYNKYIHDKDIDIIKEIHMKDFIKNDVNADPEDKIRKPDFDIAHFTFRMLDVCKIINEFNPVISK